MKKSHKLSFFSAVIMVISTSIGVGVFIKNSQIINAVGGAIGFAILAWALSILGLISIVITFKYMMKQTPTNSLGMVGWNLKYNSNYFFQAAKKFMSYIHMPIYFFVFPIYAIMTLQNTFGFSIAWWQCLLISFGVCLWFIVFSGRFIIVANITNWVISFLKYVPLLVVPLIAFVLIGKGDIANNTNWWYPSYDNVETQFKTFSQLHIALGLLGSIPCVLFAFDGFYATAALQQQMKKPKDCANAMLIGVLVVSILDLLVSLSLLLSTIHGNVDDYWWFYFISNNKWIFYVIKILIVVGMLAITNGLVAGAIVYYTTLIKNDQVIFSKLLKKYTNINKPWGSILLCLFLTFVTYLVLGVVGSLAFFDTGNYVVGIANFQNVGYGSHMDNLYSFCDLLSNWVGVFAFVILVLAIAGAMKFNKKNKIIPLIIFGCIAIGFISISLLDILVSTVGDVILASIDYSQNHDFPKTILIGTIVQLVTLIGFSCILFGHKSRKVQNSSLFRHKI